MPRLLCLGTVLADGAAAARFGGRRALLLSVAAEQAFTLLLLPVTLIFHAIFVAGVLTGRAVRWDAQVRGARGLAVREASARLALPLGFGLLLLGGLAARTPLAAALLAPGLLAAVPLAIWSSRRAAGRWAGPFGLFAMPEDTGPHPIRRAVAGFEASLRGATVSVPLPPLPRENGLPLVTQVLRQPRPGLSPCPASDEASV